MPVLDNARHERFAQALAKGKTADQAYVAAGYSANRGNAARMNANESVQKRLLELKTKSAEKTGLTVASITERLLRIAEKGEASDEAPMLTVARASLMDAAKLNGLVIDKSLSAQTSVEDLLDQLDGQQVGDTRGAPN
jgi:hypothetical protein